MPEVHLRYSLSVYNLADWHDEVPLSPDFGAQVTLLEMLPRIGVNLCGDSRALYEYG